MRADCSAHLQVPALSAQETVSQTQCLYKVKFRHGDSAWKLRWHPQCPDRAPVAISITMVYCPSSSASYCSLVHELPALAWKPGTTAREAEGQAWARERISSHVALQQATIAMRSAFRHRCLKLIRSQCNCTAGCGLLHAPDSCLHHQE